MRVFIACLLVVVYFQSCKKDTAGTAPVLSLIQVNSQELTEFTDSLTIELEYTDADGDIGEDDPDENSLYIKDRRLNEADYYFVKPLAPPGSDIRIKGRLLVQLKNTFLLGTGNSEITQFDIKLKDKARHWSNTVSTPPITIKRKP